MGHLEKTIIREGTPSNAFKMISYNLPYDHIQNIFFLPLCWPFMKSPIDKIIFVVILHRIMMCLITIGGLSIIVPIGHCQSTSILDRFHWAKSIDCWFSNLAVIVLVIIRKYSIKKQKWNKGVLSRASICMKFCHKTLDLKIFYNRICEYSIRFSMRFISMQ